MRVVLFDADGVLTLPEEFFSHVTKKLTESYPDVKVGDIIFFDDSESKIDVAKSCGLDARLYKSTEQVRELLL